MPQEVLLYISVIVAIAAILTVLARIIRQPPIIAYLFAGIIVSPLLLGPRLVSLLDQTGASATLIPLFAHIGVALLLFIVGLSLDFRILKEIGGVASVAGIIEIVLTGSIGALIAYGLGFNHIEIIYLGAALAFSSTVVIVKILSDKKEVDTLHGRIALGILIVEDFVATLALMAVPIFVGGSQNFILLAGRMGIAIGAGVVVFVLAAFVLPKLLDYLARNQEALFLFGIAWALSLATLFDSLGFSLEIGALIAGMSLASSKYTLELGGKMKPLRDFFVVLFFVFFGSQLVGPITAKIVKEAIIFSAFIILGKPLIVISLLRFFGYQKRTNFLAGFNFAQISEFSLILTLVGFSMGHISQSIMSLVILIAVITIGISSYNIYYAHSIFNKIGKLLVFAEGKRYRNTQKEEKHYDIILFGYHRIGYKLVQTLKKMRVPFAVVDYNPKVILALANEHIDCVYGDAGDRDFLSELDMSKTKLIISTIPDEASNLTIKERLKELNSKAAFIATAEQPRTALDLYKAGIDYVLIPHHLGGQYASHMIERFRMEKNAYKKIGQEHERSLKRAKDSSTFS